MNIEFSRLIKISTEVTKITHPLYYSEDDYGIHYFDTQTGTTFKKYTDLTIVRPTSNEGDTHSIEFTLPNLELLGSGSLQIYCGGDLQNSVNINVVPPTGETEPIYINL